MQEVDSVGHLSRRRYWTNRVTESVVGVGGGAVIAAITLIFGYLLWVVAPMFSSADIQAGKQIQIRGSSLFPRWPRVVRRAGNTLGARTVHLWERCWCSGASGSGGAR